jgi:hypothetical protein
MKHRIKLGDAEVYEFEHQIAASFGKGENKELKAVVSGTEVRYEVWSKKEMIERTSNIEFAVHAYNDA